MTASTAKQQIVRFELSSGVDSLFQAPTQPFRALVTLDRRPLGWVDAGPDTSPVRLRAAIGDTAGWAALRRLTDPPSVPARQPLSIVVLAGPGAGPVEIARLVGALTVSRDRNFELIVIHADGQGPRVDTGGAPIEVSMVGQTGGRLNRALNEALRIARHDLVAFFDAKTEVDSGWADAIRAAFATGPARALVSFAITTAIGSPAEHALDQRQRRIWGAPRTGFPAPRSLDRSEALTGGLFAANRFLALRRGGAIDLAFDERLDELAPGSPVGGMLLIHRLIAAGEAVVIAPAAFIWRPTPADPRQALVHQGHAVRVYLGACRRFGAATWWPVIGFAIRFWFGRSQLRSLTRPGGTVLFSEWLGALGDGPS